MDGSTSLKLSSSRSDNDCTLEQTAALVGHGHSCHSIHCPERPWTLALSGRISVDNEQAKDFTLSFV